MWKTFILSLYFFSYSFSISLELSGLQSLITIISTVVVAGIPTICNEVISIIERILPGISIITSPITTVLSAIALILTYFGIKDLLGIEDHKDSIKKYAIIKLISAFVLVILLRIGIY